MRQAFAIDYLTFHKIQAITRTVIYGYLNKYFWRKVEREKSVTWKGITYHFPSPTFNFKKQLAPVFVSKIFKISTATNSRLNNVAYIEGFIKLKKNDEGINMDIPLLVQIHKYADLNDTIVYHKDDYNPLGLIIKNVSSSVFCVVKRNKKCLSARGRYLEPFLMKFSLFSILFSGENHSNWRKIIIKN